MCSNKCFFGRFFDQCFILICDQIFTTTKIGEHRRSFYKIMLRFDRRWPGIINIDKVFGMRCFRPLGLNLGPYVTRTGPVWADRFTAPVAAGPCWPALCYLAHLVASSFVWCVVWWAWELCSRSHYATSPGTWFSLVRCLGPGNSVPAQSQQSALTAHEPGNLVLARLALWAWEQCSRPCQVWAWELSFSPNPVGCGSQPPVAHPPLGSLGPGNAVLALAAP